METNLAYRNEPWREEVIGGKVFAMAPPSVNHSRIPRNLGRIFGPYLRGKTCETLSEGTGVFFADGDYLVPDFMIVCDPDKVRPDGVHGGPDLVVEVLSPGTERRDRSVKMQRYAEAGVREYWLIGPGSKSVEQYFLENGRFILHDVYTVRAPWELEHLRPEELAEVVTEFRCSLYDDLTIRLDDIFEGVR